MARPPPGSALGAPAWQGRADAGDGVKVADQAQQVSTVTMEVVETAREFLVIGLI